MKIDMHSHFFPDISQAEAARLYERAAQQGDADAQDMVSWMKLLGGGCPQDYVGARLWAEKAAAQGRAAAMARLGELLARQGAGNEGPRDLGIDSLLMPSAVTPALIEQIEAAGPFGAAAPAPRFAFANVAVQARRMGETHLRLSFGDGTGPKLEAVAFGAFDGPLGPALENPGHHRFHLVGRLELNHWGGRTKVQLRLEDAAIA